MSSKKHTFQTEIKQLLDLMIHSLYSNKEIFLRELISNASDALDKLNYLTISDDNYKNITFNPRIDISFDEKKSILRISDSGLGMDEQDLIQNLGTIAKSGTKSFLNALSGDAKKDSALIGQFGVGFYSAFMVAQKIVVTTKKAGLDKAYSWISDGSGEYEITPCKKDSFGTEITLFLKDDDKKFANRWEIESIIKKYSEHIAFPIFLSYEETKFEGEGENKKEIKEQKCEQLNTAKAIWKTPKNELKDEDYKEFYKSFAHDNSEPLSWIHTKVEGTLEYSTLFFIPSVAPFDLYRVDYQSGVKLYVKRVFITDDDKELLPQYLRFVRGVIDSEDLPLNVSREILQQNKILANIKSASTKKILAEIATLSKDKQKYDTFYTQFGKVLKEGLYADFENKDKILDLLRFDTQTKENLSLKDYKDSMPKDQKSIYYLIGENKDLLKASPILEKYAKKGFEVILLSDEIDGFVMPNVGEFDKTPLKDATGSEALKELGETKIDEKVKKEFQPIIDSFKEALGDEIKDVELSDDLTSPIALVGEEQNAMMANLMRQMGQEPPKAKKTIQINISHEIFKKLQKADSAKVKEIAHVLFDCANLLESGNMQNAKDFSTRLNAIIIEAL
ncbi:molecular chaperone HtpG [Helicobacter fennelliae]|uniref:Chaperone protein HtpG n=3 Tax=Helicobacter TaxID=209 RepID=T1DVY0_9HELI|nr:molecular chaperone HtpG [Helicobacter fennelliae]GAD18927.1 chaperone protein HtpG [Helicobacter fennelliae MRY12-0050]SQB98383.1 Chaperone protein HtpG [Helicobacter fennelliae]STP08559.1 Chaperone protein HtpG [Helicobacter fennelliae]